MYNGSFIESVARSEEKYRQQVLNPRLERRAMQELELAALDAATPRRTLRRRLAAWLGDRLVRLGERLGAASPATTEFGVPQQG